MGTLGNIRSWALSQLGLIRESSGLINNQLKAGLTLVLLFGLANLALVATLDLGSDELRFGAGDTLLYSVALTSLALGGPIVLDPAGTLSEGFIAVYPLPTLFVLILFFVSMRRGAVSAKFYGEGAVAPKRVIFLGVASWSLTIFLSLLALSFVASVSPGSEVPPLSVANTRVLLVVLAITALPAALSGMTKRNELLGRTSTPLNWLSSFFSIWLRAQAVFVTIGLTAVLVFLTLDITFKPSVEIVEPVQPELTTVLAVLALLVIISPLLLAAVFFASSGVPVGFQFDVFTSSIFTNGLSALDPVFGAAGIGVLSDLLEFSIYGSLGQVWILVPALVAALTALISGAAASAKTGWSSNRLSLAVAVIGTSILLVLVAFFASIRTESSNGGVSANTALPGQLVLEEAWFSWGPSILGTAILAAWVGIFASLGATRAFKLIANSFTKSIRFFSRSSSFSEEFAKRSLLGNFVGKGTAIIISLSMLLPITLVSIERGWAMVDGGHQALERIADQIVNAPLDDLKNIIVGDTNAKQVWLSDEALQKARPSSEAILTVESLNSNGDAFQISDTDLNGTLTWQSDPRLSVAISSEAEVTDAFWLIQRAVFEPMIPHLSLEISPSKYHAGATTEISVNGQLVPMENKTYSVVPGVYQIKVPAYELVAASDTTFGIGSGPRKFEVPAEIALPNGADLTLTSALDAKVMECEEVDDAGRSPCFTASNTELKTTEGVIPEAFYEYEDTAYSFLTSACSADSIDVLRSSSQMRREVNCEWQVGYKRSFFDFEMKTEATYRTVTYRDYCSNNWWDFSICTFTNRVKTGEKKVKVRGDEISTLDYVATISRKIIVNAELDSSGTFKVTEAKVTS